MANYVDKDLREQAAEFRRMVEEDRLPLPRPFTTAEIDILCAIRDEFQRQQDGLKDNQQRQSEDQYRRD